MGLSEELKKLIKLQDVDTEIISLKSEIGEIPLKLKELDDKYKEKQKAVKDIEEQIKAVQLERKECEGELASKEETAKKYQAQLFQVKTNKEYSSLQKEIEDIKADASVLEEKIIGFLEKIDELNKNKQDAESRLKKEKTEIDAEKTKLQAELKAKESQLADKESTRKGCAEGIDGKLLEKYDKLLDTKGGQAIARIKSDACGGCFINLPPQVINEVRMGENLKFCDSCLRILYYDEEQDR
jgi:hypothetical protein